jgi:hypothetical protein
MKIAKNRVLLAALAGFIIGVLWLVAVRLVTFKSDTVHYHANFSLYINGERDEFKNFTFYEEVQSCGSDQINNPKARVHMHDFVSHLIHVHETGVMWNHFFSNLGYNLDDTMIKNDKGLYVDGQNGKLAFILNGEEVENIANEPIKSGDVLLINYGNDSADTLKQRYNGIKKDAGEYNQKNDPSSCAGSKKLTFTERLKQAVGISQ